MSINFPTSPSNGDVHSGFIYDSTLGVWNVISALAVKKFAVTAGSGVYVFNGDGTTADSNPTLYLTRGETYEFEVNASGHPFYIKTSNSTGTSNAYSDGVTNNGTASGTIKFVVQMDAPDTLHYNCQYHSSMNAPIYILDRVDSINDLSDVDTSTAAPTNGQALVWDNTAGKWEPGTISSGTSYTNSDVDTHLNTGTASANEVLSWTGSDYDWVAQSAGGIDALTDVDTSTSAPSTGDLLQWDGSNWVPALPESPNRNKVINGNFDVWQRGTSFSALGYGADRWRSYYTGGTTTVFSQQSFTLGQTDVPGNPEFYARLVVTSDSTSDSRASFNQKIEDVRTFAGQTVTVSFWAKANATKDLAIELLQYFGTGGSPSSYVTATPQKFSISSTWTKYTKTFSVPSIAGKTLGTNNNDYIDLAFWMDAGSDYNSRTSSLGNQSGTFEFAQVQIEKGDRATQFEHKRIGEIKRECYRYYQSYSRRSGSYNNITIGRAYSSSAGNFRFHIAEEMRTAPSISFDAVGNLGIYSITNPNTGGGGAGTITAISASGTYGPNHVMFGVTTNNALTIQTAYMIELNNQPSNDRLIFDAEL